MNGRREFQNAAHWHLLTFFAENQLGELSKMYNQFVRVYKSQQVPNSDAYS